MLVIASSNSTSSLISSIHPSEAGISFASAQPNAYDSGVIQSDTMTMSSERTANTTFFEPLVGNISSGMPNNISSSSPTLNMTILNTTREDTRINQGGIPCSFIRPEDVPVFLSQADKIRFIANRQISEKYQQFSQTLGQPLSDQLVAINAQDPIVRAYYKEYQNGIIAWSEMYLCSGNGP